MSLKLRRYLLLITSVIQAYVGVHIVVQKPAWVLPILFSIGSSSALISAFETAEDIEHAKHSWLPRFRLVQVLVFTTSLAFQLAVSQALRG